MDDKKRFTNKEINHIIFERIMEAIEKEGKLPWTKPWSAAPSNGVSKKEYRGINRLFLGSLGYKIPFFFTFSQIKAKGGQIKEGMKSYPVTYWKFSKYQDGKDLDKNGNPKTKTIPFLRYYNVWNIEDTTLDTTPYEKNEVITVEDAERAMDIYLTREKLLVEYGGDMACYYPKLDKLNMPARNTFNGTNEFYSTLFHEVVHSTGHEKRLNRDGVVEKTSFGSEMYSKEELVAEIGACFLCSHFQVSNESTLNNSASYIHSWKEKLKEDEGILMKAANHADKAFDFILNGKKVEEVVQEGKVEHEDSETFDFDKADLEVSGED